MMSARIGIDICSTSRLANTLARSPFLRAELFSEGEIAYCEARPRPAQHYAARWAAKEACLKTFGLGVLGYDWRRIEVVATAGSPRLYVTCDQLNAAISALGRFDLSLSLSHESDYSVAVVLASPVNDAS
jgi:holo-[acyl-carrier protein] synthase